MEQVRQLLAAPGPSRGTFLVHLSTLLGNILRQPAELKFRKIKEANAKLQAEFFAFPNARDVLEVAGFDKTGRGENLAWVFMADPETDKHAFDVLAGVLRCVEQAQQSPPSSSAAASAAAAAAESADGAEMDPAAIASIVNQVKRMQAEQRAHAANDDDDDAGGAARNAPQRAAPVPPQVAPAAVTTAAASVDAAPKFYSFSRSVGFQMRLSELDQRMQTKSRVEEVAEDDGSNGGANNSNRNEELESFIVNLFLDGRNAGVVGETLRILRVLIENLRRDPAEAKYRLLRFDAPALARSFFPVLGAPELFIGLLGFSVADDGLAKRSRVDSQQQAGDDDEEAQIRAALSLLDRVADGLRVREELENEERRRAAREALRDERDKERRAMGIAPNTAASAPAAPAANKPADGQPRRRIPIGEALAYLMGKQKD